MATGWNMVRDRIKSLGATEENGEWLKDMRGNLAMVATVIATMTFQIGLNPPGGVVQNGDDGAVNCPTPNGHTQACPGQSVYAAVDGAKYSAFLWSNTISFVLSVIACIWFISGAPLNRGFPTMFVAISMCLSLSLLALTYAFGVLMVNPHVGIYRHADSSFIIFIALFAVLGILFVLRFLVMFLPSNW